MTAIVLAPLAHMIGDYVLQSHMMAIRKTSSWRWALTHALFYSLPFVPLLAVLASGWRPVVALAVIAGTHAVIDRYRLAVYWCRWWGVGHPGIWHDESRDGPFKSPPESLAIWLPILVDNTLHLCINTAAIWWAC